MIDDPEKYFKIETFPVATEKAMTADGFSSLKGKTSNHALFKDGVLTSKHFDGAAWPSQRRRRRRRMSM